MSVGLFGKIRALFDGPIADATQIATTTDDNSPRLSATIATLENNTGSIPQVIQDIANASTIAHEAGDIIYDAGFDRALELKIVDRTARTGSFIGDSDGVTLDNVGNINGWQTVVGDWRNTLIGVHIAELELPTSGNTRPLLKWRSGNTSFTLLGVTSEGYLFINDPTTSVDSAVPDSSLVDGNILSNEFGAVEMQVGDHVTLEIIVGGTGAISFIPTYTRNDVTTQLNEISYNNAGDFNLNQIHLEHNLIATAFDRVILGHTNDYLSRETYTNDLSSNVESDVYNFRRVGTGAAFINVNTPIAFPQGHAQYVHLGTGDGTGTGLDSDQVATTTTNIPATDGTNIVQLTLRFDDELAGYHLADGATYNKSTGALILPQGQWLVCVSVKIVNNTAGVQSGNRVWCSGAIKYNGNTRHELSNYVRNSAHVTAGTPQASIANEAALTLSGVVSSDGTKVTQVDIYAESQQPNIGIMIRGAHLHAFRAV